MALSQETTWNLGIKKVARGGFEQSLLYENPCKPLQPIARGTFLQPGSRDKTWT